MQEKDEDADEEHPTKKPERSETTRQMVEKKELNEEGDGPGKRQRIDPISSGLNPRPPLLRWVADQIGKSSDPESFRTCCLEGEETIEQTYHHNTCFEMPPDHTDHT